MRAVDKGRPPLRATTRVMINVVDLPSSSSNVPHFVSNFSAPLTLMENDEVGHMVCIVAANDADGDMLWYYIVGESSSSFHQHWLAASYLLTRVDVLFLIHRFFHDDPIKLVHIRQ